MQTTESRVITQVVACDWQRAYARASNPLHLPRWASGLATSTLARAGAHWRIDTPAQGPAGLRFAPTNDFGVLDHWVTPDGQAEIYLPFRVIATGPGHCEFQFTLLRQPQMDDAVFARDAEWIARDLRTLRDLLESG
jgi:hypothetical protein